MELTLYNSSGSTCSQRVRYTLAAKGLDYERKDLNLLKGDQLKPEYLAINPNGVVPTLVHEGKVVIDSTVIMEYLEEVFPDTSSLVPVDPHGRARMRTLLRYIDEVPAGAVRIPSFNMAFISSFRDMDEAEFLSVAAAKPLRKEMMLAMGRSGFSSKEMAEALDRLSRAMKRMDREIGISGGPFLMGERITLADIAIMPTLVRLEDIGLARLWSGLESVDRLLAELKAHPAYSVTYYPGCHATERFNILPIAEK